MLQFNVEKVTPEKAAGYLQANGVNRPIKKGHVVFLARAMARGEWELNGESIKFTKTGRLLDGQHRLSAVIQAGKPVEMAVMRGVDEESFKTIDTGSIRTASDILGISGETMSHTLAATVRIIAANEAGQLDAVSHYRATNSEIVAVLERNPGIRKWVDIVRKSRLSKSFYLPVLAAVSYLASLRGNPEQIEEFIESLATGVGLEADNPALLLRERVLGDAARKKLMKRKEFAALLIKAINAYRSGKKIKQLRWNSSGLTAQDFPEIE